MASTPLSSPASSLPPPLPIPPGRAIARRRTIFLKLSGIALLVLLLHIPLWLTHGVLTERRAYQAQASAEVAGIWGRQQTVIGPVLAVPYTYRGVVTRQRLAGDKVIQVHERETLTATAFFLPERLEVHGRVEPELRRRGIYETVVYASALELGGEFRPDFAAGAIEADVIHWERAALVVGVSDLRGLRSVSPWRAADGAEVGFENITLAGPAWPIGAKVGADAGPGVGVPFRLEVALQGSERLQVAPLGKATTVALESGWPGGRNCRCSARSRRKGLPPSGPRGTSAAGFRRVGRIGMERRKNCW